MTPIRPALAAALLALAAAPLAAQEPDTIRIPAPDSLAAKALDAPPRRPLRLCTGGDVTLGTNLDTAWVQTARARLGRRVPALPAPDSLLAPLRPLLADADVVLLNVEAAIGTGPAPRKCAPGSTRCFAFRSPPGAAPALRRVAPEAEVVGNVANNHAGDAGPRGLRVTLDHLRDAGVHATGADTLATVVVTATGDSVAVLGFSQWIGPDPRSLRDVRRHVGRAARAHRRVVVTMHMGAEGVSAQRTPNADEMFLGTNRGNLVAFARAATEAGADLVVGHGPHVMRAVEWRGDALVLYSLGNLLTYGPFSLREPLNRGAVACAELDGDGRVTRAFLRPTRQDPPGLVRVDTTNRAAALAHELGALDFPATAARIDVATGEILRPAAAPARAPAAPRERRRP